MPNKNTKKTCSTTACGRFYLFNKLQGSVGLSLRVCQPKMLKIKSFSKNSCFCCCFSLVSFFCFCFLFGFRFRCFSKAQLAYPLLLRFPSHPPFTVHVPSLPEKISEAQLRRHFAQLGAANSQVIEVTWMTVYLVVLLKDLKVM